MHLKKIKPELKYTSFIKQNILANLLLTIFISLILGIVAYIVTYIFFNVNDPKIISISLIAALISTTILTPMAIFSSFWLFKHNYDPDDIMGPYITHIGDVISVLSLLIAVVVLL